MSTDEGCVYLLPPAAPSASFSMTSPFVRIRSQIEELGEPQGRERLSPELARRLRVGEHDVLEDLRLDGNLADAHDARSRSSSETGISPWSRRDRPPGRKRFFLPCSSFAKALGRLRYG